MDYFEEMVGGCTSLKPSLWLKYVDETFILWPHEEHLQILLDYVNSIRSSIQFIIKKEQVNRLSYQDVLITPKEQGFRSSVYGKPTFNSHHPYNIFR